MRSNPTYTRAMPTARRGDRLIEQVIGDETMLYDEDKHKAYLLNPSAAAVWRACDGTRPVEQIAVAATLALGRPVHEDLVLFTLAELRHDQLLQPETAEELPRIERREMLLRLGTAAALLIPAIAVVATPAAAQAYSGGVSS